MGLLNNQHILFASILVLIYILIVFMASVFLVKPHTCTYQPNMLTTKEPNSTVIVLTWESNKHWAGWGKSGEVIWGGYDPHKSKCNETCIITGDQSMYEIADAVIFEAQPFGKRGDPYPPEKMCGQKYIMFSLETPDYFSIVKDRDYLSHMDWKMSYEHNAHIRAGFVCSWGYEGGIDAYRKAPVPNFNEKTGFAVFVASNCKSGGASHRTAYVKELMNYIPIDSFGLCLRNQPKEALVRNTDKERYFAKMKLFEKYKFVLAFENNNVTDYVSEKVYHSYLAGTLPVYMGAPNIDDYEPGNHTLIRTDQFESPKHLATYLKSLVEDPEEYGKYFKWKSEPYKPQFYKHYENCVFYSECKICDRVVKERAKVQANIDDFNPIENISLATTGSHSTLLSVLDSYVIDTRFYRIQNWSIVCIFIISILYILFVVFKVHRMIFGIFRSPNQRHYYNPLDITFNFGTKNKKPSQPSNN